MKRIRINVSRCIIDIVLIASVITGIYSLENFLSIPQQAITSNQQILIDNIQNSIHSVVQIKNFSVGCQGSGVAWTEDIICTARHVVEGGTDFEITLNDGTKIRATKVILSKEYDIGFIKIDDLDPNYAVLKPVKFGSVRDIVLGQQVYAIGSPYGEVNLNNVTLGIVSGLNRNQDSIDFYTGKNYGWSVAFMTDAAGHSGNSGCPVFSSDGVVRGILVGGFSPVLIIAMPTDLFMNDLEIIEMMFAQDRYEFEEELTQPINNYHNEM